MADLLSFRTKMQNWQLRYQNSDAKCDCSRTDHYDYKVRYMAEDMMRRVAKMQSNNLTVDTRLFWLYTRLRNGRRCNCFKGVSCEADGECPICFGTGIVGGYEKFGTHTEMIDTTRRVNCVNVIPDFGNPMLPPLFRLDNDSLQGYFETDVEIGYTIGKMDYYNEFISNINASAKIKVYVKALDRSSDYVVSNTNSIESLLTSGSRLLRFKVVFSRSNLSTKSPYLSHIMIRYQRKPSNIFTLRADIPPIQNSATWDANGGSTDSFTSLQIILDPAVFSNYTSDDWLWEVEKNLRWKCYEVEKKRQVTTLTQISLQCNLIQEYETGYQNYPL